MEHGIVVQTNNNDILVEAEHGECCDSCAASGSCVIGANSRKRELWIKNTLGARIGDEVLFIIKEQTVIAASAVLYFFPVLMLFAGLLFGAFVGGWFSMNKELSSMLWGMLFLIMSFISIKIISTFTKKKNFFMPVLVEVISKNTDINNN